MEWVVVPKEPTPEMLAAANNAPAGASYLYGVRVYKAMLDAAPAAPQQAEPVVYRKYLDGVDAHVYRLVPRDDEADKWEPLYLHPPAAEVQRLREALEYLIEKCGDSDDAQYSTLGTKFVRDIARRALEGK